MLFVFRTHIPEKFNIPQIYLRGLDPQSVYAVEGHGQRSGAGWMAAGLRVPLKNFESRLLYIKRIT